MRLNQNQKKQNQSKTKNNLFYIASKSQKNSKWDYLVGQIIT